MVFLVYKSSKPSTAYLTFLVFDKLQIFFISSFNLDWILCNPLGSLIIQTHISKILICRKCKWLTTYIPGVIEFFIICINTVCTTKQTAEWICAKTKSSWIIQWSRRRDGLLRWQWRCRGSKLSRGVSTLLVMYNWYCNRSYLALLDTFYAQLYSLCSHKKWVNKSLPSNLNRYAFVFFP